MSSPSIIGPFVAHSAKVRMHLETQSGRVAVAQTGPDFVILENPVDLPPGRAELVVQIDGNERRRTICLPDGVRGANVRTRIAQA